VAGRGCLFDLTLIKSHLELWVVLACLGLN
jgi:hypothetical protein